MKIVENFYYDFYKYKSCKSCHNKIVNITYNLGANEKNKYELMMVVAIRQLSMKFMSEATMLTMISKVIFFTKHMCYPVFLR